jgi:predicted MFS family arabinose efflux permease
MANVVGVPIGTWAGQIAGWRGPFWALAALSIAAAAVIGRFIPGDENREVPTIRAELVALRQGRVWLALAASALIMGGVLATYTYIAPLLTERAGIPAAAALVLLLLVLLPGSAAITPVLVVLMGLTGFAVNPVVTALAVRFAGRAPTLAAALSTSAFNAGIAAGSWIAGIALTSSLGEIGPALVGTVITALTLVPLTMLAVARRTGPYRSAAAPLPRRLRASADFEPASAV